VPPVVKKIDTICGKRDPLSGGWQVTSLPNQTIDNEMMTVSAASSTRSRHLGVEFVVWKRGSAWFWFLTRPRGKSASIGATTNQAGAMREACWSIEAILQSSERDSGDDTAFSNERNTERAE
jgi:hypothetical protein